MSSQTHWFQLTSIFEDISSGQLPHTSEFTFALWVMLDAQTTAATIQNILFFCTQSSISILEEFNFFRYSNLS